jgi:hypothetical protein
LAVPIALVGGNPMVVVQPTFVWGSNSFVTASCVTLNWAPLPVGGGLPSAAAVFPLNMLSPQQQPQQQWNMSQLDYLILRASSVQCLSFTPVVTITQSLTVGVTPSSNGGGDNNAAAFTIRAWTDASTSTFPLIVVCVLCIIPRHFTPAVTLLRIIALGRSEYRSLSFLENPFHLDLQEDSGGMPMVLKTLNGSFVSLGIVWVCWVLLAYGVSSMSACLCSCAETGNGHGGGDVSDREDDDDEGCGCSPRKLSVMEVWVSLVVPITVVLFPWMMLCVYALDMGGDALPGGITCMLIGFIGVALVVWKALTTRQVSFPFRYQPRQRPRHDAAGEVVETITSPPSSLQERLNSDHHQSEGTGQQLQTQDVGFWQRWTKSAFEVVPSKIKNDDEDGERRRPSDFWARLLLAHLHPTNMHVRLFALLVMGCVAHAALIARATSSTSEAVSRGLFATSAALSGVSAIIFVTVRPFGAKLDTLTCVILELIALISASVCASDPFGSSNAAPTVLLTVASCIGAVAFLLTTISGAICSCDADNNSDEREGLYSIFLPEESPSEIEQDDWDVLKRILYAKLLDAAGDSDRLASDLEGKMPLELVIGIICKSRRRNPQQQQPPRHHLPTTPDDELPERDERQDRQVH